ncbi:MAG: hypothetical protein ACRCY3_09975, partial [Sphingorhabdus sp.]
MATRMGFWAQLPLLMLFLLAACSWNEPAVIDLPDEVGKVATPFVAALQKGNRTAVSKYVAPGAQDELSAQFAADHKRLKAAEPLTPRFMTAKPDYMIGPEDSEMTVIYAAKTDGKW